MDDILAEVRGLVENGYKEIVLTGINIGDFEGANGERLADLVRTVDKVEGIERLRLSSIDPDEVDDNLMDAILQGRKTCRSLHIVLQAGSNVILKRMNRKYTKQIFQDTIRRLRAAAPDFTFTTDVIVGFPGETDADFEETLEIMREVKFAKVHMFPFSVRERTRAALYPNRVPQPKMQERKQKVLRESEKQAFELRNGYVGKRMKVLIESEQDCSGHTDNFLPVACLSPVQRNTIVEVECVENMPEGLLGRVV
jgi:threonylcarbamoyladenosine tRNA methylthiotransferase MtaB